MLLIYRFDIDGSTFSPPAHEDQFFYIRYPNAENKADNQSGVKSLTDALKDLNTKTSTISSSEVTTQHDFSKQHTDSCKKFLKSVEKGECSHFSADTIISGSKQIEYFKPF